MATLRDILLVDGTRPRVIEDCVRLIDDEVASKSGLAGMAVKGAYAVVKKIKPGIIREAVDRLVDEFVDRLELFYAEFVDDDGADDFAAYLPERRPAVADALLQVTDQRIENAENRVIKKAYGKLRPTGQKHVQAAVPGVGRVIARFL